MSTAITEVGEAATMRPARNDNYELIKPWLDRALALIMLLLATPIIILAIVLVKMNSRGSWIFLQKRLGLRGSVFTIYKIRTMYEDSERDSGATWCVPGDRRITPVGRFLRWCHVDELPQLINVLRGDMSLVGPRPERPEFLDQLERALPDYRQRLAVRPGLTGLAQVQQVARHRPYQRTPQAELRSLLPGTDESMARLPRDAGHGSQVPGCPVQLDRSKPAIARSERPLRLRIEPCGARAKRKSLVSDSFIS